MAQPSKTFYSPRGRLTISPPNLKGEYMMINGRNQRVNEKLAEFMPFVRSEKGMQGGDYGSFTTSDPDLIAYLEERAAMDNTDVFTAEMWHERMIPVHERAAAKERQIEEKNSLIASLQEQLKQREGLKKLA